MACCCNCCLQERPEDIPTGELPRTLLMVVDRHLVGRVTPGSRLVVTGIYCTHRWANNVRRLI
jgi:DNA replication licensing factor MCM5